MKPTGIYLELAILCHGRDEEENKAHHHHNHHLHSSVIDSYFQQTITPMMTQHFLLC